jgi:hypothetical protein
MCETVPVHVRALQNGIKAFNITIFFPSTLTQLRT